MGRELIDTDDYCHIVNVNEAVIPSRRRFLLELYVVVHMLIWSLKMNDHVLLNS